MTTAKTVSIINAQQMDVQPRKDGLHLTYGGKGSAV